MAHARAATPGTIPITTWRFLKGLADRWQEVDRIVPLVTDILYAEGVFIHAMPHRAGSYKDRTPLMREIRREGIDL